MKSLHVDLLAAQAAGYPTNAGYAPYITMPFIDNGGSTLATYTVDPTASPVNPRVLSIEEFSHDDEGDTSVIRLNNYDRAVPDLRGTYTDIGWGLNTASGVRSSASPRMWVLTQRDASGGPKDGPRGIITELLMGGVWSAVLDRQPLRIGTSPFYHDENGLLANKTVYAVIAQLFVELTKQVVLIFTLDALGTQDDGIINTWIPFPIVSAGSFVEKHEYQILVVGDTDWDAIGFDPDDTPAVGKRFTVPEGAGAGSGTGTAIEFLVDINPKTPGEFTTYGALIRTLMGVTNCHLRPEQALAWKVVYPQSSDAVNKTFYSSLSNGHPFYEVTHSSITSINQVEMHGGGQDDGIPDYVGYWYDPDHYTSVTAGSFTIGIGYYILTVGTTDYTLIGATANTVGLFFIATGAGSGTGTAYQYTGNFMAWTNALYDPALASNAACAAKAAAVGRQIIDRQLGMRVTIPMDASLELFDNVQAVDTR